MGFETVFNKPVDDEIAALHSQTASKGVAAVCDRWLRPDFENNKKLIIQGGTSLIKANGSIRNFSEDTTIDLSSIVTEAGKDYFVYILNDGSITAARTDPANSKKIGRFHTLCVSVGTPNMLAPAAPSSGLTTSDYFLVKSYREDLDPDFYAFYRKPVLSKTQQTYYDVITVAHPLSGYVAGDILPESVFCLTFYPDTLYEDAMVYDQDTKIAVDIYLQSGSGHNTRSAYNATHKVSTSPWNHQEDMRTVGKKLLRDCEFTSAALGSNERTNITGSSDKTTVGGHVDTANRRMISAIGCEEMCGYLWQWLDEIGPVGGSAWNSNTDGHDQFGQNYGVPYVLLAGGDWGIGSSCGSRSRAAHKSRSAVAASCGGRGSSRVKRG